MSKTIHDKIADNMPPLSHLECTVCHRKQDVGDVSSKLKSGWPKCHGYTMTLITEKQAKEQL